MDRTGQIFSQRDVQGTLRGKRMASSRILRYRAAADEYNAKGPARLLEVPETVAWLYLGSDESVGTEIK